MWNNSTSMNGTIPQPMIPPKEIQCSDATLHEFYFQTAFLVFILLVTFFGNLMVVLAVASFHRLRTITNYFVVSLALSDLLVATLSLPFRLHQTVHNTSWCLSLEICIVWIVIDIICSGASIWNLAIISIDRFVAIVFPFRYHSLMTPLVGYCLIAFAWLISLLLALLSLLNWTEPKQEHFFIAMSCGKRDRIYYTVVSALEFYLPLLIVLVMYGNVFKVAMNQARAVAALQLHTDTRRRGRRSSINLVKEVKAAKTLAIVIGCFVICWFPFFVLILISLWDASLISVQKIPRDAIKGITLTFIYVLPALNSTMNPIIYALFNRDFRYAFLKIIKRFTGGRLGAVGLGETSMSGTADTRMTTNGKRGRKTRFQEDTESSDALPTIPMRESDAFHNEGYDASPACASISNGYDTTGQLQESQNAGHGGYNTEPFTPARLSLAGTLPANPDDELLNKSLPIKLPPIEKSTNDDDITDGRYAEMNADHGYATDYKPLTLPPLENKQVKGESNMQKTAEKAENGDTTDDVDDNSHFYEPESSGMPSGLTPIETIKSAKAQPLPPIESSSTINEHGNVIEVLSQESDCER